MMGATRRWYDQINATIGSTPGTISTTVINATTISTTGAITASGPITGSALNSTGNASVAGTLTAGSVSVSGAITYTGNPYGHGFGFGWDGGSAHVYVDGTDVGVIGDIQSVSAGNGLTGGGSSGAVTLAMSGSYGGNFTATGSVNAAYLSSTGGAGITGGLNVTTSVQTPVLFGGSDGSAGTLLMVSSSNRITFRWDGGVSGGGAAAYRIDGAVEKYMCTTANTFDLQYAFPGGGPTTVVIGGHDVPGTWYYAYIDYLSDERIKDNIAPSEIDAVTVLNQVPVSQFDIKGPVAAWLRNIGMDTVERIASMQGAEPVHVPIGFVAQRIQPHIPDAVAVARQDGAIPEAPLPVDALNINKQEFIPYLVRAIQQLAARVEALEAGGT
jgi:hypothetical protein